MKILSIIILSTFCSWYLTKLTIKPFKKFLPDIPNERSSHKSLKPRGGGLAFILVNFILAIIFKQNIFIFLLPLSIVSFLDDFFNLSRLIRLIIQFSTSFYLLIFCPYFDFLIVIENILLKIFLIASILLVSTAIINFCNFMDGIDGILTGSSLVILISYSLLINGNIWTLIGSLLGFIFWNWKPSKIFMGDIGSNFLGGAILWTMLNIGNLKYSIGLILIASPILMDPLICLIRRLINKQNIFQAHSLHLYQRLNKGGLDHAQIAIIYILSSIVISTSFFIGGLSFSFLIAVVIFFMGVLLDKYKASPFLK